MTYAPQTADDAWLQAVNLDPVYVLVEAEGCDLIVAVQPGLKAAMIALDRARSAVVRSFMLRLAPTGAMSV